MIEAFINPTLIRWARERYQLDTAEVAQKLHVAPDLLEAWERGETRPSFRQAQEYAQKLKIPFGYLFLSSPPKLKLPLPDLRTIGDARLKEPSPEFYDLVSDVMGKQEWYREYRESTDPTPVPFVGRFPSYSPDDTDLIAQDISKTLGINEAMRMGASSWEQFLVAFIRKAQEAGVLVLRNGVVGNDTHRALNVEEFRGFAISDDLAPLIFINSLDAKAAQVFTLAHELAHLWLGQSAISDPNYFDDQNNPTERFCSRIAAELLVPKEDFLLRWNPMSSATENAELLSRRYRVSSSVILRRALDLSQIDINTYRDSLSLLREQQASQSPPASGGGGNFYTTLLSRNSLNLTKAIIGSVAEGRLLWRDAARLLNVQVSTLSGIAKNIFGEKLS